MEIQNWKLKDIKPYPNNPRINDDAVEAVANSIKEFGWQQPIVVDKDGVVIAGHTRLKAAKKLGLKEAPVLVAENLTEEQVKAYRLADNKVSEAASWDMELLGAELDDIFNLNMAEFGFDIAFADDEEITSEPIEKTKLTDQFIVPPLSVLDTKQGYWQERKHQWKELGIKSEEGREAESYHTDAMGERYGRKQNTGTSIFDPVLCEVMYKWFNVECGSIYDCFAGGSVRGIVAEYLGYKYTGIDLRQEQIDANYENAAEIGVKPNWICDDSLNADKYIKDESVDMIFSCPPYADLEVYSDDVRDISNMDYEDFKTAYKGIIDIACRKLKPNRFAVFVVGDIRDKKGFYRNFIDYTKECFNANGLNTYNEMILLDMLGTAMIRCVKTFKASRKVAKVHQNVLVFYKGDPTTIKDNYKEVDVELEIEEGGELNG